MTDYGVRTYNGGQLVFDSTKFRLSRVFDIVVFTGTGTITITDDRFLSGTEFVHQITGGPGSGVTWALSGNVLTLSLAEYPGYNIAVAYGAY